MRLPNVLSLQVTENEGRRQEGNNVECQPVGHRVEDRQLSTKFIKVFRQTASRPIHRGKHPVHRSKQ